MEKQKRAENLPYCARVTLDGIEAANFSDMNKLLFRQKISNFLMLDLDKIYIRSVTAGSVIIDYIVPSKFAIALFGITPEKFQESVLNNDVTIFGTCSNIEEVDLEEDEIEDAL
jgi:hypothetical protein